MITDYRAMCAELVDSLENARRIIQGADGTLHINTAEFVLRRARALLAQPVAEGPTDEEVDAWADQQEFIRGHGDHPCGFWIDDGDAGALVRAALARYGRPTPQPPAAGEVADLAASLRVYAKLERIACRVETARRITQAADMLERFASDNAGLEAAAESAYLDNLSLLDNQND